MKSGIASNGHNGHNPVPDEVTDHQSPIDDNRLKDLARELLLALGEDPEREGLKETPRRWAAWWKEFIEYQPGVVDTTFETTSSNQMVVVSGMRVYSICEHHLLPFWCDVSIGYIPHGKVLGLSKFARIAQQSAHKLQLQERLVGEIADEIQRVTESPDVMIMAKGFHLCMLMRGIRTGAEVSTLVTRGQFLEKADFRADFLRLAAHQTGSESH